ncbi:outer membrane protein [Bartonella phoceensis]|uniref:outer membrane protein n=1 Tax=Bartonella phoceensis TaxID=270249 RepID=UPI001ABA8DAD|nr:outer membrane protein [Bartonella phoceensis]
MNTRFITASIFAFVSSSIVQAADVVVPEEPTHVASAVITSPPFSWVGFYLGGQVGRFSSKTSAIAPDVDIPLYPDEEARKKKWVPVDQKYMPKLSGFIGGVYAGANFDLGNNFILGIDTDIIFTDRKDIKTAAFTESDTDENGGDPNNKKVRVGKGGKLSRPGVIGEEDTEENRLAFSHTFKQKWEGATRMRIGFSAGRLLPYIAGGVAYGQFQDVLSISLTGDEIFNKTSDVTNSMIGYTLGGGVDFAVTDNIIMRAEYRYSDFGKKKFKDEIEIKYKTNDFRAGIAYKF